MSPTVEVEEGSTTDAVVEKIVIDLDEDDHALGHGEAGGRMQGVKEVDLEITDDESEAGGDAEFDQDAAPGGGIKRKRTIRVVIRSRAFL